MSASRKSVKVNQNGIKASQNTVNRGRQNFIANNKTFRTHVTTKNLENKPRSAFTVYGGTNGLNQLGNDRQNHQQQQYRHNTQRESNFAPFAVTSELGVHPNNTYNLLWATNKAFNEVKSYHNGFYDSGDSLPEECILQSQFSDESSHPLPYSDGNVMYF